MSKLIDFKKIMKRYLYYAIRFFLEISENMHFIFIDGNWASISYNHNGKYEDDMHYHKLNDQAPFDQNLFTVNVFFTFISLFIFTFIILIRENI